MKIKKTRLNDYIDVLKLYFETHDTELAKIVLEKAKYVFGERNYTWTDDICTGIAMKNDEPYETYYKVLEVLGYEIY